MAGLNISYCFCLCSALEEEGLHVSQPPQGHQQERLCLRQLELSPQLRPCVWVGGNTWTWQQPQDWRHWQTEERDYMVNEGTKGMQSGGAEGGVVSYLDGRPLEISARTWRSDAAKLLFTLTALVSDGNKKEATLTTSCVCPIEGNVGGPEAAAGPVCPPEWFTSRTFVFLFRRPCSFLSSLLDTRHLLSLDWVIWQRRRRPRRS